MSNKFKFCPLCSARLVKKKHPQDEHKRLTCQKCGFIFYQNPTPTVLAIIQKGNKILLTKRAISPYKGWWDIPGGFVETGQNLEQAVRQEIKEELGVEVQSLKYFSSFPSKYKTPKIYEDLVGVAFKVKLKSHNFKTGSDINDVGWFNKTNLPKLVPHQDVQQTTKKLLG